jgi:hypothetical protein
MRETIKADRKKNKVEDKDTEKKIKKIIPEANYDNEAKKLKRKINCEPSSCGLQKM